MSPPRTALSFLIHLHAFVTGALVMACEMVGSRWLAPWFGGGIHTWAALIATVLAALAVGYALGGRLADRRPRPAPLGWALLVLGAWLGLLPVVAPAVLAGLADGIADERIGALLAALALLGVPGVLLGAYPPYAVRLALPRAEQAGTVSGRIYALSTVGGIVGTLGTPFVLIPLAGTRAITYGIGLAAALAGLSLLALSLAGRRGARGPAALLLVACGALMIAVAPARAAVPDAAPLSDAALLALPDGVVANLETPHAELFVRKRGSLLFLSHRVAGEQHLQSIRDLAAPGELPAPYTRVLSAALLYAPQARRLLMLGLGGGMTSRYLQRHVPGLRVQVVELDAGAVRLASRYFGVRESEAFRIAVADARVYLNREPARHDVIVADAYRGDVMPFHLLTREFFALVRERLAPGGVLAINLIHGNRLFDSALRTLRTVFAHVETYATRGQVIAFAFDGARPTVADLAARAAALQGRHGFVHDLRAIAARNRLVISPGLNATVLSDDFAPVEHQRTQRSRSN